MTTAAIIIDGDPVRMAQLPTGPLDFRPTIDRHRPATWYHALYHRHDVRWTAEEAMRAMRWRDIDVFKFFMHHVTLDYSRILDAVLLVPRPWYAAAHYLFDEGVSSQMGIDRIWEARYINGYNAAIYRPCVFNLFVWSMYRRGLLADVSIEDPELRELYLEQCIQ